MTAFASADPALDYCYLTTTGRVTGLPREIEIWFAIDGDALYVLSGGRDQSHWVKNLQRDPAARIRIGAQTYDVRARFPAPGSPDDALARRLLFEKYEPRSGNLASWRDSALPVAFELRP